MTTTDPHTPGVLTLRADDGATLELDTQALPPSTLVILQFRGHATIEQLDNARRLLAERIGEDAAARFVIVDERWRIWPVTLTEPQQDARS